MQCCLSFYYFVQQDVTSEAVEGDPKYLAPEILMGKVGRHVDIFRYDTIFKWYLIFFLERGGELSRRW